VTGSLVSPALRQRVRGWATPIATALGRLGLTPNALTVIGLLGTGLAALFAARADWLVAGILVIVFGIFDLFDGTLARATGRATRLGAFLDSSFDRAGESLVYLGIAAGCLAVGFGEGALLSAAAMAASLLVSYVRAKAESLGFAPGSGLMNVGLAPREVRLVLLAGGLVLLPAVGPIGPWTFVCPLDPNTYTVLCAAPDAFRAGDTVLGGALGFIAILATITVVQRVLVVARASRGEARPTEPRQAKEG
jgi:CDP-diacylglycerol--glycerol-3-phosphate 3-phosphatidyltransferase